MKKKGHKQLHLFVATLMGVVTIIHAIRVGFRLPMNIGNYEVPMYISWLAVILLAYLSVNLWKTASQ